MVKRIGPAYLRLGNGSLPPNISNLLPYAPIRKISSGTSLTIIGIGPVILNALKALSSTLIDADVFVVSEVPLINLSEELLSSMRATGKVLILEEHVARGGLGENLSLFALRTVKSLEFYHVHASGYLNGLYGSQHYHQVQSALDEVSLANLLRQVTHG
jgi:transketolase